jgi:hypothetical protein
MYIIFEETAGTVSDTGSLQFGKASRPVDILPVAAIRKAVAVDPPTILCHPRSSAGSWRATHFFRTKQNNNALLHVLFTGRHSGLKEASRVILEITSVTDIDEVFCVYNALRHQY